jgi:NAD(P)-dependent dehydrogenase (short-subunit alcohol dehydrogenase family)
MFSGIGAAVAKGFARSGCMRIAITDIKSDTLKQTKDAIRSIDASIEVFDQAGDIADEQFVDSFTDEVTSKFSRLDYAVNCAGVLGGKPVKAVDMTMEAFDRLNDINYRGSWLSSRAQLRNMLKQEPLSEQPRQRGSIVNIASQLGIVARPGAGTSEDNHELILATLTSSEQLLIAHRSLPSST